MGRNLGLGIVIEHQELAAVPEWSLSNSEYKMVVVSFTKTHLVKH